MTATATETYELKVPTWAICPLEYGDLDGLEQDDIDALNGLLDQLDEIVVNEGGKHYSLDFADNSYFSWNNDVTSLGDDVIDMTVTVFI